MQFSFPKKVLQFLECAVEEVKNVEITQELRLTDGMPDIGRVLTAWGQVMLRSKQWVSGEISLSGGVKMWVLYVPEDNTEPRVTEGWIPFQMKWDARKTDREGPVRMMPLLRYADGRSVSPRKLMLRAGVGVLAQGMYPMEAEVYVPEELPEQVQILKSAYPVRLPVEAGEKTFLVDEDLELEGTSMLISYTALPEITEKRILTDKIAFKGCTNLRLVFAGYEGKIRSVNLELPFSQLVDLDGNYGTEAQADIRMAVTDLEADMPEEGKLRVKCGMVAQYLVDDRQILELAEDAYCPGRALTFETASPEFPVVVEERTEVINPEQTLNDHNGTVVDVRYLPDHPRMRLCSDQADLELPGVFQILYYREDGTLQSATLRCEDSMQLRADGNCHLAAFAQPSNQIRTSSSVDGITFSSSLQMLIRTYLDQGLTMLTSVELGENEVRDSECPSVILRRAEEESLWDIAKACGSTVDAIRNANSGLGQGTGDRMLLIPVL